MNNVLIVTLAFLSLVSVAQADPASGIEASREVCLEQDGSNPGTIACDQKALQDADQLIATTIARIKSERLTGKDAHGVDLSQGQALLDQAQKAFEQYRSRDHKSQALLTAVPDPIVKWLVKNLPGSSQLLI